MVMCFVPDCKHYSQYKTCIGFFRFPRDEKLKKIWIKNIRRHDKLPSKNAVVCSCHFLYCEKENGPTIFRRKADKFMMFPPPEKRQRKTVLPNLDPSTSNVEPSTFNVEPSTSNVTTKPLCSPSLHFKNNQSDREIEKLKAENELPKKHPFSYQSEHQR